MPNKIIPYKKSGNDYYYVIINIEGQYIMIRQYIFNSFSNTITYQESNSTSYYVNYFNPEPTSLSCLLMKYSETEVIICFFVEWNIVYHIVLNTNTFQEIS